LKPKYSLVETQKYIPDGIHVYGLEIILIKDYQAGFG
jgi:hypothetical protein